MTDYFDNFSPYSKMGQTGVGAAIRGQNQRAQQAKVDLKAQSDRITQLKIDTKPVQVFMTPTNTHDFSDFTSHTEFPREIRNKKGGIFLSGLLFILAGLLVFAALGSF